jgi:hypothetical protein
MISNNGQSKTRNSNSKLEEPESIHLLMVAIKDEFIDSSIWFLDSGGYMLCDLQKGMVHIV